MNGVNYPPMAVPAMDSPVPYRRRTFQPPRPVDLMLTLGPLPTGRGDLAVRLTDDGVWRATRTPTGPVTTHLFGDGPVTVEAWGPGAEWAVEHAPTLVGGQDDDTTFVAHHPVLADLRRRLRGLRMPRTEAVLESLVPTILEQKVAGVEARRAYRRLLATLGEPAPGPGGLTLPPTPSTLAATPYWVFHPLGVERRRAETIRRAASRARRLEETVAMTAGEAFLRLTAIPGIGTWSAAKVAQVALGDADAVPVGDYHLPHLVAWSLAGVPRGTDAMMLEVLEPYRGHRARVLRLLLAGGQSAPRFGPRLPLRRIATQ
jgi:3-methyladenine DNA glycosylase/8-oxoguanine DNA glycosylase